MQILLDPSPGVTGRETIEAVTFLQHVILQAPSLYVPASSTATFPTPVFILSFLGHIVI